MTTVALLAPYTSPVPGGISSFTKGLDGLLTRAGYMVYTASGEGEGSSPELSSLGRSRTFVQRATSILERIQPDVVHCHGHWYTLAAGLRYSRNHPRARLVFSFHTTPTPRFREWFRRLLRRVDVVTFVSSTQLAEVRASLKLGGDLRILRPATDAILPSNEDKSKWVRAHRLQDRFPVLVFAGPLEYPRKIDGVVDLVSAVRKLRVEYPKIRLLIVGDGRGRRRVELAAQGVGEAIEITGFVQSPRAAFATADIYCHISYQEGLPLALLEAMSTGVCVVASPTGGIPEVVTGANGMLVEPGPAPLAAAISELTEDKERRHAMGIAARETILGSFVWEKRMASLSSIYGWT